MWKAMPTQLSIHKIVNEANNLLFFLPEGCQKSAESEQQIALICT